MQVPTCTNIRIRSTHDAHKIFYAVRQGLLQMVTRRLDADERLALAAGCVYAWEERGPHSEITGLGIERFTEGRRWSPSRVRDEFLFYYEKYVPPPEVHAGSQAERLPPRDWDPLVKQTYSVWVETGKGRRKWHLTAYFTQATVDRLGTVDDIPGVRDLAVPEGMFKSTRVSKNRNKPEERSSESSKPIPAVIRTYAPFPTPAVYPSQHLYQPPMARQPDTTATHTPYPESSTFPVYFPDQPQSLSLAHSSPPNQTRLPSHEPNPHLNRTNSSLVSSNPQLLCRAEPNPRGPYHEKVVYESQYMRFAPVSQNPSVSFPPVTSQELHQIESDANYSERSVQSNPSQYPQTLYYARTYDPLSYNTPPGQYVPPVSTITNPPPSTLATNNGVNASNTCQPESQTLGRPFPDLDAKEKDSNLPPLHSVEGLHASIYELTNPGDVLIRGQERRNAVGPCRDLAPLHSLTRPHPYRREPLDDKTLRRLRPRD